MMKREKGARIFWAIVLVLWLLTIFLFSAQPAEESGKLSDGICYKLAAFCNQMLNLGYGEASLQHVAGWLSFPVRKAAHMTEYAVLALLVYRNLLLWKRFPERRSRSVLSWVTAVCCAGVDEIHQLFVEGRCGTVKDVCIDAIGAALGLLLVRFWLRRRKRSGAGKKSMD